MAEATIREGGQHIITIHGDSWREIAEEIGSEIDQLFANEWRPRTLTITFGDEETDQ